MVTDSAPTGLSARWVPLATFQLNVARRWLTRGSYAGEIFAQFFFYFAGFNAIYFLWGKVDDVRNQQGQPAGEEKQIHNLLKKFTPTDAQRLLGELESTVRYFRKRRPIQRMDRRGAESPIDGETVEGMKWRRRLQEAEPVQRLIALGSILYLVRSNLVHGSKMEAGDDEAVIRHAVPAVKLLLEHSVVVTESALRRGAP